MSLEIAASIYLLASGGARFAQSFLQKRPLLHSPVADSVCNSNLCEAQRATERTHALGHGAAAFRMGCGASTPAAGADPVQEKFAKAGKGCIAHGVPLQPGEGYIQAATLSTMSSHQVPCIVAGEAPPARQTAKAAPAPKTTPAPVPTTTTTTEPAAPAAVAKASSFDFEKGTFIFG